MRIDVSFDPEFEQIFEWWDKECPEVLEVQGISREHLDFSERSRQYFETEVTELTIDKNANTSYFRSPTSYASELTKPLYKLHGLFLLWKYAAKQYGKERARELIDSVISGDVYFHDSSGILVQVPYCVSISAFDIAERGMPFNSQLTSRPPRHADSFVAQVVETMFSVGNQVAGAVAVPDFLVALATFTKRDGLTDYGVRQLLQRFVFSLNQPMRSGVQSLFSNVSIYDKNLLVQSFSYRPGFDLEETQRVQRIFAELVSEGVDGLPYKFPVLTANLYTGNGFDQYFVDQLAEWNAPLGAWNIYADKRPRTLMCCRLSLDNTFFNTFGSGDVKTGSTRVVTLNLPRIAVRAHGDHDRFWSLLDETLERARQLLKTHRDILKDRISRHFLMFFDHGFMYLSRMFSTFGVIGLFEMARYMGKRSIEDILAFMGEVLDRIEGKAKAFSKQDGYVYNVEAVPAEQAAFTLSKLDEILYGEKQYVEVGYSNQFIPLYEEIPLKDRIDHTGRLDSKTSGGGILHINIGERISRRQMKALIAYAMHKVIYFAVNYVANVCRECSAKFIGLTSCPKCGEKDNIDRITRVVGYYVPLRNWSKERQREFQTRFFYRGSF